MDAFVSVCTLTGTSNTVIAHGLPAAPDEFYVERIGVSVCQFQSAPSATNMTLSAAPNGAVALVVARVNKTVVR
jgi:hypothetical protein